MHAVLLANSTRILFWGYGQRPDQARLWDQATGLYTSPANQPIAIAADENIWSGAHAHLNDAQGPSSLHGGFMTGGRCQRGHRATRVPVQSVDQQLQCGGGAHHRPVLPDHPDPWRRHGADAVRRRSRECGRRRCPVARDLHAGRWRRVERAEGGAVQLLLLPVDLPAARWRSVHRRAAEAGAAIQPGGHADRRRSGPPVQPDLVAARRQHGRHRGAAAAQAAELRPAGDGSRRAAPPTPSRQPSGSTCRLRIPRGRRCRT